MPRITTTGKSFNSQSRSRIGMSVGSSRFEEETRAFLQRRLRILTTTVAMLFCLLTLGFVIVLVSEPDISLTRAVLTVSTTFPNTVVVFLFLSSLGLALILWRKHVSETILSIIDTIFLQILVGPCLFLYAKMHHLSFSGFQVVVPFIMLFILARAILIPSRPWRTLVLSLPAALFVLVIQLIWGGSYIEPGQSLGQGHFFDSVLQNQILLLGAIAVASIASKVNLGLRRQNFNARHVGQYKIERLLGKGGMGEVYLATHALMKRPTAIKFLKPELAGDRTLKRFEQEVRHSSRLSHPHNISIYDYGHTADGIFYYAMEYLRGFNLREIVSKTGPMCAARVIHVLTSACSALGEAHSKEIVHRDIKPENIMLCRLGGEPDFVKILDFGLVKDLSRATAVDIEDGSVSGTPETIAPEALTNDAVGPASDMYSLCAVGCYLLTGFPLFEAETSHAFLNAHISEPPIPPSSRISSVPADLERILLKGLEKDPEKRHEDIITMKGALCACKDAGGWNAFHASQWWDKYELLLQKGEKEEPEGYAETLESSLVTMTLQNLT